MPQLFQNCKKINDRLKAQTPFTIFAAPNYFGLQAAGLAEVEALAHSDLAARPNQRLPFPGIGAELAGK